MLKTIEIEIDEKGYIHSMEPIQLPIGHALLTILEEDIPMQSATKQSNFNDLFGILTPEHGATLEEIEQAISAKMSENINDCN